MGASGDHFRTVLVRFSKIPENMKTSKFFGMIRDALGGVRGSSLSNFDGFSKDFEKLKIRNLKIGRNRVKMG